jgi:hypothetical protein
VRKLKSPAPSFAQDWSSDVLNVPVDQHCIRHNNFIIFSICQISVSQLVGLFFVHIAGYQPMKLVDDSYEYNQIHWLFNTKKNSFAAIIRIRWKQANATVTASEKTAYI